jgi:hypothetical protein
MTVLALLAVLALAGEPVVFKSAPGGTSLLELFSSEGCSSCPPADKFIGTLKGHRGLWRDFVPAVFHVDYWDYLGWKDCLASPRYTQRQSDYGRLVTPEFILNGQPWWDASADIPKPASDAGTLEVRPEGLLTYHVSFKAAKTGRWLVHAALLGFGISTDVKNGENSGVTLKHDFAALGMDSRNLEDGKATLEIRQPNVKVKPDRYGVAVWITRLGENTPVQAAGGYLAAAPPAKTP